MRRPSRPHERRSWAPIFVSLALVGAGCGATADLGNSAGSSTPSTTVTQRLNTYSDLVEFDDVLDFAGPTLDGGEVNGANYANRTLAIWFWAPW